MTARIKLSGVYKICNTVDGKVLVGSSSDLHTREREHWCTAQKGEHRNAHFQAAWNLVGASAFRFEVLELCSRENLILREDYWMSVYKSLSREYGYNTKTASGVVHSEETKYKMSLAKQGTNHWIYGKHHSEATKSKIAAAQKGVLSNAYGRPRPASVRAKISKGLTGRPCSAETRKKISKSNLGRKWPEESRVKFSAALVKRFAEHPVSAETRAKMSASQKLRAVRTREAKALSAQETQKLILEV